MNDPFAQLGVPRRPFLDEESLKERFHQLSAALHPDTPGGDAATFAALNQAHQTLRDPVLRIRHLLELERPDLPAPVNAVPADLGDLFMQIGALRQKLETLRRSTDAASTPIARALLAPRKLELTDEILDLSAAVAAQRESALAEIAAVDAQWNPQDTAACERLRRAAHLLAFHNRWFTQLREDLFQLDPEGS